MRIGLALIIFQLLIVHSNAQGRMLGGKEQFTADDFNSEGFQQVLKVANTHCNEQLNDEYWHKAEKVADVTRQVVEGMSYEFKIHQRPTDCLKIELLGAPPKKEETSCVAKSQEPGVICTVSAWHRPWLPINTKVSIKDLWRVQAGENVYSESQTELKYGDANWMKMHCGLADAIFDYNLHNATDKVYRIAEKEMIVQKTRTGKIVGVILHLGETECEKLTSPEELRKVHESACYKKMNGMTIECKISFVGIDGEQPVVTDCEQPEKNVRGMWRSTAGTDEADGQCNLPFAIENERHISAQKLHNLANSHVRSLTLDEINHPEFQEAVKLATLEYNRRVNHINMFQQIKTEHEKLRIAPKSAFEFTLTLRPTNCRKTSESLEDFDKNSEVCNLNSTEEEFQKCRFTVPQIGTLREKQRSVIMKDCKPVPGFPIRLMGAPMYFPPEDRANDEFQALLNRIVEQYSAQNDSVHQFKLVKAENIKRQTVAGQIFTLNITMKATGYKDKPEEKISRVNETFHHCSAKVFQQTWNKVETITISKCWQTVRLKKPIEGKWESLSAKDLNKMESKLRTGEKVPELSQFTSSYGEMTLNFLTNVYKLKVLHRKLYTFDLHMKNVNASGQHLKCKALLLKDKEEFEKKMMFVHDCKQKEPASIPRLVGAPISLEQEELQSEDTQKKLAQAAEAYNLQSNDLYYHRFVGVKNATRLMVSGVKTTVFLYLEQTECRKNTHAEFHRLNLHSLCGKPNNRRVILCQVDIIDQLGEERDQVEVKGCQTADHNQLAPIRPVSFDLRHSSTYGEIIDRAVLVYNLYRNHSVFYRDQSVENFTKLNQDGQNEYRFDLFLRPTRCAKWNETILFLNKQFEFCKGLVTSDLVRCNARVTLKKTRTFKKVELDGCEHIIKKTGHEARLLTLNETSSSEFQKLTNESIKLFTRQTQSPYWFELVHVENPMLESISGQHHSFKLHMVSTGCREENQEDANGEAKRVNCEDANRKRVMVSCSVEVWNRDWDREHKTIDVTSCRVLSSDLPPSSPWTTQQQRIQNEACVNQFLPKFVELFNKHNEMSEIVAEPVAENIEEQSLPGKRVTFDIYFKPQIQTPNCSVIVEDDEKCVKNYFYACKASFWIRPAEGRKDFELHSCDKAERVHHWEPETDLDGLVQDFKAKAVKLYNEKLAKNYVYGAPTTRHHIMKTAFGTEVSFELHMEPVACLYRRETQSCKAQQSNLLVICQVIVRQRPWQSVGETILLKSCFETFGKQWEDAIGELTSEEQNQDSFKQLVFNLAQLHTSPVPIVYALKKVQNTKVHNDGSWRNITLELLLQPVGCNDSLPGANDPQCVNWSEQEEVKCEGAVSYDKQRGGMSYLSLSNCHKLWQPAPKRPLTPVERDSRWFKESVGSAWRMQNGLTKEPNLYTVVDIVDPTIEVTSVRTTSYSVKLLETECLKKRDEERFMDGFTVDCPLKDPSGKRTCSVTYTEQADGRHGTEIRCQVATKE